MPTYIDGCGRNRKFIEEHRLRIAPGKWGVYYATPDLEDHYIATAEARVFDTEVEAKAWGDEKLLSERSFSAQFFKDYPAMYPVVIDHRLADGTLVKGKGYLSDC